MKIFRTNRFRHLCLFAFSLLVTGGLIFGIESQPPSAVPNLQAQSGDASVTLTWDSAEDPDGLIIGYKVYYGTESSDEYPNEIDLETSDTTYTLSDLNNGVTYYFSVTAIDDAGIESDEYSNEVSARPVEALVGGPSVVSAEPVSQKNIAVSMSEPIIIKSIRKSFFLQAKEADYENIEILGAEVEGDKVILEIGQNVLITGASYVVTASSAVEDLEGNPVSSGITDTAVFEALDPSSLPETYTPSNSVSNIDFTDPVVNTDNPLFNEGSGNDFPIDSTPIPPKPEPNQDFNDFVPEDPIHTSASESYPPEDISEIRVDSSKLSAGRKITISWTASNSSDVVDQIFYTRKKGGAWDRGFSVGASTLSHVVPVQEGQTYEVKIVAINSAGQSSEGITYAFDTTLSRSGSGTLIFFFGTFMVGILLFSRKRV